MQRTLTVHDRNFEPFILSDAIADRVHKIAEEIKQDVGDQNPLFLAVLNGAFIFAADLLRQFEFQNEISFVKISSYHGTSSTGAVKELIGFTESIQDRHIVIIEDIIDTGLSMQHVLKQVESLHPRSVRVATLLLKKDALKYPIAPEYVGFEIENRFVLGYGLDYNGLGRHLPHIYVESNA